MTVEYVDCVVIGAGVVGLAVARELALAGREVIVLEAEAAFGTHTSARNSEVIHAGLSYPQGSLKARLCVEGRKRLYEYCAERGVAHRRIGKLIVATEDKDRAGLDKYRTLGEAAGVEDLRLVGRDELAEMEPEVQAVAGLYSPLTGIVDSHGLMLSLLGDAENAGASLVLRSPVKAGRITEDGLLLEVGGEEPMSLHCSLVINAAGLYAHKVAACIEGLSADFIPQVHYAVGQYFTLSGPTPFRHLVYPVSRESSERVHVTLDLAGQCKFGPDLRWIDSVDYSFEPSREAAFYQGIRRYYPGLADGALVPGYTGIRPRLDRPGAPLHGAPPDFRIEGAPTHGCPGLVNLFGIESPGLTSCLAIGAYVRALVSSSSNI